MVGFMTNISSRFVTYSRDALNLLTMLQHLDHNDVEINAQYPAGGVAQPLPILNGSERCTIRRYKWRSAADGAVNGTLGRVSCACGRIAAVTSSWRGLRRWNSLRLSASRHGSLTQTFRDISAAMIDIACAICAVCLVDFPSSLA